jgi:hypothetical protein
MLHHQFTYGQWKAQCENLLQETRSSDVDAEMSKEYDEHEVKACLEAVIEDSESTVAMLQKFVEEGKTLLQEREDKDKTREIVKEQGRSV